MRNNWTHWRRVSSTELKVGQKIAIIDFTLPVNASNILIELQTSTLAKPLTGKEKSVSEEHPQKSSAHLTVTGLDTVLSTLPISVLNKIGYTSNAN